MPDKRGNSWKEYMKNEWREYRGKMILFVVLRIIVIGTLILQVFNQNWNNVFLCILTLILFMIPAFVEHQFKIDLPTGLEVIVVLFIFAAEILGEINEYYLTYANWDAMLHTLNGFLAAAIGMALIDILNKNEKAKLHLSPPYIAMWTFCFAMTVGAVWEFFEYGMDKYFGTDMQKDTWIDKIVSVSLNEAGTNDPVTVNIDSVLINGQEWPHYLDIGLIDTMGDLWVNFIGALVFSVLGLLFLSGKIKGRLIKLFIPRKKS